MAERNPNWTRVELILALDLYMRHRPAVLGNTSAEVIELSEVLNRLARADRERLPTHRNANGIAMKRRCLQSAGAGRDPGGCAASAPDEWEMFGQLVSSPQ